jgi:hypothetical protein
MIAMTRIPRVSLILVAIALLALLVAPVAGARTVSPASIHPAGDGWIDAGFHWLGDLAGLWLPASHGHSGVKKPVHQKDDAAMSYPAGSSCIDPQGHPRPCL